ncbi:Lrp/AsnC family transcriptional regulator [bacterium]|nr:Lrp/AsnC family transcriptional regulator [bacterium]
MEEILKLLEQDARLSPEEIAALTGKDAEEVKRIIKECEEKKIIRRYKAIIDWEKAGKERVFAFIDIKVIPSRGVGFDEIAKRIYRFPEVHSVYLVSGRSDLKIVVEGKDLKEVALFVANKLATIEGVTSTETHFLLKKYKDDREIFVEEKPNKRLAVSP